MTCGSSCTRMIGRSAWPSWSAALATWVLTLVPVCGGTSLGAQEVSFARVGSIPGPIDLVDASGVFAYAARSETLTVFDIADPAEPVRRGSHTFPEKIWGFTVVGSRAYVAAGHSGLFVLDVSDPEHLHVTGSITTPGQAKNVAVSGRRAVVADHMSGIDVIDLSDASAPVSLGSVYTDGYARDVAMFGPFAYGVDNPSGLYVLDLDHPDPLEPVGMIQSAPAPRFVEILEANPSIAVLVGGTPYDPLKALRGQTDGEQPSGALHLYDVADPAAPAPLTSFSTPGAPQNVVLRGTFAYVADGDAGLSVVDLSTASAPRLAGTYRTDRPARDVAVADTAVLVLVGVTRLGAHTQDDGDIILLRRD